MKPPRSSARLYDHLQPARVKRGRSLLRAVNSRLVSCQYAHPLGDRVLGFPKHLIIDPVNYCNLHCPLCPSGTGAIPRAKGLMPVPLFKRVLRQVGPYLYTLILTNWGEPLLHPHVLEMVQFARRYPVYLGLSSNFHHLDRHGADALLRSGLDEIAISIDGIDQAVYEQYRRGGDFNKVMANLRTLLAARERIGRRSTPKIRWQYLVTVHSEPHMEAARAMADELGVDELVFVPIYIGIGEMFTATARERWKRYSNWLPRDHRYRVYDDTSGDLKERPKRCHMLYDTLVVNWDGTVSPCCAVIDPAHDFGDLNQATVRQVWNNRYFRAARRLFRRGGPVDPPVICRFCLENGVVIY